MTDLLIRPRCALICLLLFAGGCVLPPHIHRSEANRPGHVDVASPPDQMHKPERIQPRDPGGFFLAASLNPVFQIGTLSRQDERERTYQFGGELWLGGGTFSSQKDDADGFGLAGLGVNLGWLPLSSHDAVGARLFGEASIRYFHIVGFGAGWSFLPGTGVHGPQITLGLPLNMHLRWNLDIDSGWSLMYGFAIPLTTFYLRSK